MAHQPPISPDTRKKKPALPSLLSSLRNAHSAISSSVAGSSEARPFVDHNGSYASDRSNMKRSVTASLSASTTSQTAPPRTNRLNPPASSSASSLSSSIISLWRKRNQHLHKEDESIRHNKKRRRQIRVSIPSSFLFSVVCLFIITPILVLLYVLARKSVFGDEGVEINEHKYEVHRDFDVGVISTAENKQESVLNESENQFKEVEHDSAGIETVDSVGDETVVDPVVEAATEEHFENDVAKTNQSAQDLAQEEQTNELQRTDATESENSNLRGTQLSDADEIKVESMIVSNDEIDQSDQKVVSSENIESDVEDEELTSNINLESPQVEVLGSEEGSG